MKMLVFGLQIAMRSFSCGMWSFCRYAMVVAGGWFLTKCGSVLDVIFFLLISQAVPKHGFKYFNLVISYLRSNYN